MTIEQRLTFLNAGYTKDEIAAMEAVENPTPQAEPEPEQPKPAEPEQSRDEPKQEQDNSNKAVLDAIAALTAAIQLSNVQKTGLDTPGNLSAADALAQGVFGNK